VSGDNLFLWSRYSGIDPEVHTNAVVDDITVRGIDYLNYPRPRTITTGIRFSF
jgi:TonB-dependent starch-binding outer membrane protein SusC